MALLDEVQARYSTQLLVAASNPQNSGATTEDASREAQAVSDIQAWFNMRGMTYDNDNSAHVAVAVQGVYARLLMLTGQPGAEVEWREFKRNLKLLTEIGPRERIAPFTDSLLTPTKDTSGDIPLSDRNNFRDYVPESPSSPTTMD